MIRLAELPATLSPSALKALLAASTLSAAVNEAPVNALANEPAKPQDRLDGPASVVEPQTRPRIFAVVNQKGGVGKTTTAVNLATALAAAEKRVLLIDIDPQGNASTGLGITAQQRVVTIYDVLMGMEELGATLVSTSVPGLQMVPSSVELAGAELELVELDRREYRLRDAIDKLLVVYDYILVDCPPSLGLLTLNAMVAADAVLVPLQCEFYALEGLSHLVRTIDRVKRQLNPSLDIQGVILTMFDKRNNLCDLVATDVRGYFGEKVYQTMIPRNVRISEAPSHGKPVLLYDWRCAGSQAYIHLASEVLYRERDYAQEHES